jgi:hypothetical protein
MSESSTEHATAGADGKHQGMRMCMYMCIFVSACATSKYVYVCVCMYMRVCMKHVSESSTEHDTAAYTYTHMRIHNTYNHVADGDVQMADASNSDNSVYEDAEMQELRGKLEKAIERLVGGIAPSWSDARIALETMLTILRNILQVYACVYIYIYVLYTCIYIYIHTHTHAYMHTHYFIYQRTCIDA